jgi:putative Holliday junction resolvase
MKLLGIDYGKKRIGIAHSDEQGRLAFPNSIIENGPSTLGDILEICNKEGVSKIIIGESKDYQMEDNEIMNEARDFASKLEEKTGIKIEFHLEFMSSVQVSKELHHAQTPREQKVWGEKGGDVDAQAATIILQSYIDSNK